VTYEVMAKDLDEGWWLKYHRSLEARFPREQAAMPAQEVRLLCSDQGGAPPRVRPRLPTVRNPPI
jgi:hypothetical protein